MCKFPPAWLDQVQPELLWMIPQHPVAPRSLASTFIPRGACLAETLTWSSAPCDQVKPGWSCVWLASSWLIDLDQSSYYSGRLQVGIARLCEPLFLPAAPLASDTSTRQI